MMDNQLILLAIPEVFEPPAYGFELAWRSHTPFGKKKI
jgi:hypothetical protein